MDNKASKTRSLDIAFVVDAKLLRRLAVILGETSDGLEYTVKFSDGTSVHYEDIEDVISQPNSNQRSITSLIAGTAGEAHSKAAYVNLKTNGSPSAEYTINGRQRDVIYFADQLDDWVSATRQWYSPFLASEKSASAAGAILALFVVIAPFFAGSYLAKFFPYLAAHPWIQAAILSAMWVTEYFVLRLFPRGTFATGGGERRNQFNFYVRNTVLAGLVLSISAGVIANWISKHPL